MGELTAATKGDGARVSISAWARRNGAALAWAMVAAAVRALWLVRVPPVAAWDGAIYHRTAERIARGLGFVDTWNNLPPYKPTAFYPVGYPAMLGAGYALFGAHPWVAGLINVLSGAVCTYFVARFAAAWPGRAPRHAAAALYAFSPGAVVYSSAFMTEPASAALLCGAVAAALRHRRRGEVWSALLAGALLGAGGLVRPPALMVAPVLALVTAPPGGWAMRVRTLALVGVACCAVVLPWTARNCARLDACALVSVNGGSNLWIGTDPAANGGYRDLRPGEGCDAVHGEVRKDRCYGALAWNRIRAAPGAWLALAPEKLVQLYGSESTPVSYLRSATHGAAFATSADLAYRTLTGYHLALLGLALVGLFGRGRWAGAPAGAEVSASLAAILSLSAVHVVFFGVDRYHFVFTPLLCFLAGGALRRPNGSVVTARA